MTKMHLKMLHKKSHACSLGINDWNDITNISILYKITLAWFLDTYPYLYNI